MDLNGTPIFKESHDFNLGSKNGPIYAANAKLKQFPLRLAYAQTGHKMQVSFQFHLMFDIFIKLSSFFSEGQTVPAENQTIIHWKGLKEGMAYTMLGRSVRQEDIHIADGFDKDLIKCNEDALNESRRLEKIFDDAENVKKDKRENHWKISYLNVRSLNAHQEDVSVDNAIIDSDIIGLGETWLEKNELINLDGFSGYFANFGKGKGQAGFTKLDLVIEPEIVSSISYSAVLFKTNNFNIIFLYLSENYPKDSVFTFLENWIEEDFPTAIMGDVNENILGKSKSKFQEFMESKHFHQMIQEPTYISGSLIDHLYINETMKKRNVFSEVNCCAYSDHDILSLYFPK